MKLISCSCQYGVFVLALIAVFDAAEASRQAARRGNADPSARQGMQDRFRKRSGLLELGMADKTLALISSVSVVASEVAADAELGADLNVQAKGGPASLKEYCAGGGAAKVEEGAKVEANWKGMGTDYPGVVQHENKDGSVDVLYDDGFVEKDVKMKRVVPLETSDTADDPSSDPACELVDFVDMVKKMVDETYKNIAAWLANAKMKQEGRAPPTFKPPTVTAPPAAPSAAPAGGAPATNDELERLKKLLSDKDAELAELEKQMNANDEEILGEMGLDTAAPSGIKTVDDLITEYIAKIAERSKQIENIKARLQEQQEQLFAMGARTVDLESINGQVKNISALCDEARAKRDKLAKEGRLDEDLGHSLEHIFETSEKLNEKVASLLALDRASKKAGGSGDDKAGDEEMLKAAMEVEKDLKGVQESAKQLDEGLHPHGDKWWRYRYEHSYVEAVLMVLISIVMLFWERGYHFLRHQIYKRSQAVEKDSMTHGTMYVHWLEYCAGELMVCLLAFLTVWLLAKINAFDMLPLILAGSDKVHLPHTGDEYRRIAIDISVVLFFAVLFYYFLVLSVVHHTTKKLNEWAKAEAELQSNLSEEDSIGARLNAPAKTSLRPTFAKRDTATITSEYQALKHYFTMNVLRDEDLLQQIQNQNEGKQFDVKTFPFWAYLRLNVRSTVDKTFMFGWTVWILIVLSFVGFCFLHRYAHMGYIRIMITYAVALAVLLVAMMLWINRVNQLVDMHTGDPNFSANDHAPHWVRNCRIARGICHLLHYVLFFLCYGASRMICQPWMWELHFWPVLILTIVTCIISIVFVLFCAPMIPIFAGVMALPPYTNQHNLSILHECLNLGSGSCDQFVVNSDKSTDRHPKGAMATITEH